MSKRRSRGDRFRLLIYERMWQRWAWPCILIVPLSVVLWWFAPQIWILHTPFRALTLVPALVSSTILVYAFLARRLAYVQCKANHLRVQTPIYPLAISYRRIKGVRPSTFAQVFNPADEKAVRRSWLEPYWGKTVLVVELSKYPFNKLWLRLWLSPYLFTTNVTGFVFLVEDWMALSRQLDQFRTAYAMRRAERRRQRDATR